MNILKFVCLGIISIALIVHFNDVMDCVELALQALKHWLVSLR